MTDNKKGIALLFEDESLAGLSDDVRAKTTVIFETAVLKQVKDEVEIIKEDYETKLEESKKENLNSIEEHVDSYLSYVVDEWMEQNVLAVESGIKTEIAENFMSGMKDLFEDSYVNIPENKVDVVAEMSMQLDEKDKELNDIIKENIKLTDEVVDHNKNSIVNEEIDGLADSEKDRIESFIEMVEYEDADSYRKQVKSIIEAYTKNNDKDDDDEKDKDGKDKDKDGKDKDGKDKDKKDMKTMKESVDIYADAISGNSE